MLNVKCASQVTGRVFKYIDNYSFIETNRFELYPKPVDCVKVQRWALAFCLTRRRNKQHLIALKTVGTINIPQSRHLNNN